MSVIVQYVATSKTLPLCLYIAPGVLVDLVTAEDPPEMPPRVFREKLVTGDPRPIISCHRKLDQDELGGS